MGGCGREAVRLGCGHCADSAAIFSEAAAHSLVEKRLGFRMSLAVAKDSVLLKFGGDGCRFVAEGALEGAAAPTEVAGAAAAEAAPSAESQSILASGAALAQEPVLCLRSGLHRVLLAPTYLSCSPLVS